MNKEHKAKIYCGFGRGQGSNSWTNVASRLDVWEKEIQLNGEANTTATPVVKAAIKKALNVILYKNNQPVVHYSRRYLSQPFTQKR